MDGLLKITDEAITFATKTDFKLQLFLFYCMRSMIFLINEDLESAKKNLMDAGILLKDFTIKYCKAHYLLAKSYIEIAELKKDQLNSHLRKQALNTTNDLIQQSKKVQKCLPEAFRLKAQVYWITGKPGKALKYFLRSINLSLQFDGNLELSRTYFEAGKFLRDPKNKKERINGMNGTECLLKAKAMFEEMNLQWDLAEYEKYTGKQS
jgi:tetratricopeptide (TPR) repeat protein